MSAYVRWYSIAFSIDENTAFFKDLCKEQNKCIFFVLKRGYHWVLRCFHVFLAVNQVLSITCFYRNWRICIFPSSEYCCLYIYNRNECIDSWSQITLPDDFKTRFPWLQYEMEPQWAVYRRPLRHFDIIPRHQSISHFSLSLSFWGNKTVVSNLLWTVYRVINPSFNLTTPVFIRYSLKETAIDS